MFDMNDSQSPAQEPREIVFAACKVGSDPLTVGRSCDGRQAYKNSKVGARLLTLTCTKCSHSWSVPVGGSFNY